MALPVDARTKAGRAVRMLKLRLLSALGPRPSQTQLALVEQALQLKLRLVTMDQRFLASGGQQSIHDSRIYLAWSNSLVRVLRLLGLESLPADAPLSLAEALLAGSSVVADGTRAASPTDDPRSASVPLEASAAP